MASDAPPGEPFDGALRVDVERTRAARAAWTRGGAEACGCAACRAWIEARETLVAPALRDWLAHLGIAWNRESDARPLEADPEGAGWELLYHLVGDAPEDPVVAAAEDVPRGAAGLEARRGAELAPASWDAGAASVELRVRVSAIPV